MHGTHGDLTRGHGYLREELGHIGQKALEHRGGNGSPNQPLDDRRIGGVKGMEIGVRFPFFKQQLHLPDIMPPKVEAFTRCTSHPKNGYATGSLWRCPSWWSCSSPPPASRAGTLLYP